MINLWVFLMSVLFCLSCNSPSLSDFLNVDHISVGGWNTCVVKKGKLLCWGDNSYNQLPGSSSRSGTILRQEISFPSEVSAHDMKFFVGGYRVCILSNQELWCSGRSDEGQRGQPHSKIERVGFSKVPKLSKIINLSLGAYHSCAVIKGVPSKVFCWGDNKSFQISETAQNSVTPPAEIKFLPEREWIDISAGFEHTCVLSSIGEVYCWGGNSFEQLASAEKTTNFAFQKIKIPTPIKQISSGRYHTCALSESGEVHCWGANHFGQLGVGNQIQSHSPQLVKSERRFVQISLGGVHSCAVGEDTKVYCWGANSFLQVDPLSKRGSTKLELIPKQVQFIEGVSEVHTGHSSTCVLSSNNLYSCWGTSSNGLPN